MVYKKMGCDTLFVVLKFREKNGPPNGSLTTRIAQGALPRVAFHSVAKHSFACSANGSAGNL